jgi:hypothetical protein
MITSVGQSAVPDPAFQNKTALWRPRATPDANPQALLRLRISSFQRKILAIMELVSSVVVGVGLAAACGFRVFVPLLVLSVASLSDQLTLAPGLDWIGTYPALVTFAIATLLEIGGYYVPWIDNLLDTIATPAAVVAGTVMMGAVVTEVDPFLKWALALIAGGGTAGAVQGVTVLARGASTLTTGGLGNPLISTGEAGGSAATASLAIFLPWLALGLVVLFVFGIGSMLFRRRKESHPPAVPTEP